MQRTKVWDMPLRMFHWALVLLFAANALIVDHDSATHLYIGYAIVALVAFRLIWGMAGTRHARFASFPPSIEGALGQIKDMTTGRKTVHTGHTPLGALMIYNLLLTLAVIGLSGYLMTTDMFWGTEWTAELHEAAVTWAEFSVVAHIAAVIYESLRTGVNLPRAMVTGYKDLPDT